MKGKGNSKWLSSIVLCLCMAGMLTGCGAASADKSMEHDAPMAEESIMEDAEMETVGSFDAALGEEYYESGAANNAASAQKAEVTQEKLIKTVDLEVETKTYDDMMDALSGQIAAFGGYVENMSSYNGSIYDSYYRTRHANVVIRIPADRLTDFLAEISQLSNVVRKSEDTKNVTLAYVDLQSRKKALVIEEERLLELLEMAKDVADIITINERLAQVHYEIENMESSLRTYDNKIQYSTINLYIEEVKELTPVEEETIWQRITRGFEESLRDVGEGILDVGIWFITKSPILLVWAIILGGAGYLAGKLLAKRKVKIAARKLKTSDVIPSLESEKDENTEEKK